MNNDSPRMHAEHSSCLLVGWPLPDLAAEGDATGSGGRETRHHLLADKVALVMRCTT